MHFSVITLFPGAFESLVQASLFGKALEASLFEVELIDLRAFGVGRHKVVDDTPFGGGAGMVMKVEPIARALQDLRARRPDTRIALLCPQGEVLNQRVVERLAALPALGLLCGRYEGVDERARALVDMELSIGDYVLSGGEAAAWVVMDAVSRLVPGVLGCSDSLKEESFARPGRLEYPHYTRPREYCGAEVPEVLLSGDHAEVARFRRRESLRRTVCRRPELLREFPPDEEERVWLQEFGPGGRDKAGENS